MLRGFCIFVLFSIATYWSIPAFAASDPLTGVRISLLAIETVLAAPPLPDLIEKDKGHVTVQGSYIAANVDDTASLSANLSETSTGNFRGGAVGVGFTTPSRKAWGYYGFITANYVAGNLSLNQTGNPSITLSDMKNYGYSAAGGISLRLWSARTFPLTFGIFAGPTASLFSSKFSVLDSTGNNVGGNYSSTPFTFGGMGGVQAGLALGPIYLNPYIMYYEDFTNGCKSFSVDNGATGPASPDCPNDPNSIKIPLSFGAYGINVGFKRFLLNVYSHVNKDSSLDSIDLHNYQLSYTFDY